MKLEYRKTWKVTEAEFFRKFLVFGNRGEKVKFVPKFGFFENILRTLHQIFLFFCMKLDHIKACQKSLLLVYQKLIWAFHRGQKVKFYPAA